MVCNFNSLKEDFQKKRRMALFVGAGINISPGVHLAWDDVLNNLFSTALYHIAMEKNLSNKDIELIKRANSIKTRISEEMKGNISREEFENWYKLHKLAVAEFPAIVKASIIKNVLGNSYITTLQEYLYKDCNRYILKDAFEKYYRIGSSNRDDSNPHFHTLYQLARIIILSPSIKAIISYNYDNFLKYAIEILWREKEEYFTQDELEVIGKDTQLNVRDISGLIYDDDFKENDRFIYHVHGYIQSPSEVGVSGENKIILSSDEFYEDIRNVYTWQSATQLHYLSHYTCIFAGSSISDITIQRMLYCAKQCGNNEKIYHLCTCPDVDEDYAYGYVY